MSLVEVLVAIVLLGTVVIATVTAVRSTVLATRTERDHAKAYQWLQSAVGVLQAADRTGCDLSPADLNPTGEDKVRTTYQDAIRDGVINPVGWKDLQLTVLQPVEVWDGTQYWDPYSSLAPKPCYDSDGFKLQLITIQVTSPDGRILEKLQVVKDGSQNR
jgi:type II secretory pathway pseudopilin PulG